MRRAVKRVTVDGGVIEVEQLENILAVACFEHGPDNKLLCNACPTHTRNLACPPFSPLFADYIGSARQARVICLRLPLARFRADSVLESARAAFRLGSGLLDEILLAARRQGHRVAGSGECRACERCAAICGGDPQCVRPDRRIYSLESLGVQVAALVKACFNIELEWASQGQPTGIISAVGAIF